MSGISPGAAACRARARSCLASSRSPIDKAGLEGARRTLSMNESSLDALTSPTLKNLREYWWSDEFTAFLRDTLRPRPGNRILDVGCGEGAAEVSIGRLHLSQIRLFGIDHMLNRVIVARYAT